MTDQPTTIPARHDRLAAAMLTPLIDHGLREAVKWVMEPELLAMEAEIERQVRAKVAAEIEAVVVIARRDQPPAEAKADAYQQAAKIARGGA